jgi:fatty acid desaturase
MTKKLERTIERTLSMFRRKMKRWSLGTAVFGLTFLFGVAWAALIAILLKIERAAIMLAVAAGAVASGIFWTLALAGVVGFLPEPWMLYLILGLATFAMLTHGKLHERKMLREVSKTLKRPTHRMEDYPVVDKSKKG